MAFSGSGSPAVSYTHLDVYKRQGEARRISQAGCRTRPYILGPAFPEEREEIVLNGWRSFISTIEEAVHLSLIHI